MKRKARRNPLPPPIAKKTSAKSVNWLVDAYGDDANYWRWFYAATESLKIAYRTMADHGWLPDGSDVIERTIETAEQALRENNPDLLRELAHEKTGEEWERLDRHPWHRKRDTFIYGDVLKLSGNYGDSSPKQPSFYRRPPGEKERAKRYLLQATGDLMVGGSRHAFHLVCMKCRDIMALQTLGYAVKQPGRRITAGEEIIAQAIVHAMTVK